LTAGAGIGFKEGDTEVVPHPGNKIHIPLRFEETVRGLLKVKPTKDMPRPGATKKAKKKSATKKRD
jgi:hypothetical protein